MNHRVRVTIKLLRSKHIHGLERLRQVHDLNPSETLWPNLKIAVQAPNVTELEPFGKEKCAHILVFVSKDGRDKSLKTSSCNCNKKFYKVLTGRGEYKCTLSLQIYVQLCVGISHTIAVKHSMFVVVTPYKKI